MLLPHTDSFVLIRGTIVNPHSPAFLPNTHSFLLIRRSVVAPRFALGAENTDSEQPDVLIRETIVNPSPAFLPHADSFLLIRGTIIRGTIVNPHSPAFLPHADSFLLIRRSVVDPRFALGAENAVATIHQSTDSLDYTQDKSEQPKIKDQSKRNFLKVAGIAGAGVIISQLSPNKAQALIMGSSPTTGVVGVKNVANTRINPATQETVSSLLKTSDLTFDTGSLQVKVTSLPDSSFSDSGGVAKRGLVNAARNVQVDVVTSALPSSASTETTLQTISFGGKKYALRLTTVGSIDYVGEADTGTATSSALWRAKKVDNTSGIIITWADGNANFDNVATDLTTLTYS